MLQPRRRGLYCCLAILLLIGFVGHLNCETDIKVEDGEEKTQINPNVQRVKRNADVTTVFVVPNSDDQARDGRHINKAVGVLTSTARTFVLDGATTEFATQVVGTTLDNGRLYARLLSTSSRVFYDPKTRDALDTRTFPTVAHVPDFDVRPTVVRPHVVYPSEPPRIDRFPTADIPPFEYKFDNSYQTSTNDYDSPPPVKTDKVISVFAVPDKLHAINSQITTSTERDSNKIPGDDIEYLLEQSKSFKKFGNQYSEVTEEEKQSLDNFVKSKRMDYFSDVEGNEVKPDRVAVKPEHGLPTYTIRHEFAPSGFSFEDYVEGTTETKQKETSVKSSVRSGKALFRGGVSNNLKKLDTVTYFGFADFTTTVGDTVILFMPNTKVPSVTGKTIKSTSVPEDSPVKKSKSGEQDQISVVTTVKTFMSHTPGMVTRTITGHSLTMETALPTTVVLPASSSIRRYKALESVHVIDAVSPSYEEVTSSYYENIRPSKTVTLQRSSTSYIEERMPFDMTSSFLAHEQQAFKSSSVKPDLYSSDITIEPSSSDYEIDPSSVKSEYSSSVIATEELPHVSPVIEGKSTEFFETSTPPLYTVDTTRTQTIDHGNNQHPEGLIKALAGTRAANGTTTLFTSLIYGTFIGKSYAQIIHSTSNVFFFVDDPTTTTNSKLNIDPTSVAHPSQSKASTSADNVSLNEITTDDIYLTTDVTTEQATDENKILTTYNDDTLSTLPIETTTIENNDESVNEVETARKVNVNSKNQIIISDFNKNDGNRLTNEHKPSSTESSISETSTDSNVITQLIPTTVYKTYTYLTTFFIPAGVSSLTTSVNSREVTTSEIAFLTKLVSDPRKTNILPTRSSSIGTPSSNSVTSFQKLEEGEKTTERSESETTTNSYTTDSEKTTEESITEGGTTFIVTTPAARETTPEDIPSKNDTNDKNEEIELILKTLYTTYTYFTTFFQESTSSVTSSESVVTNIITTTVDKDFDLEATDPAVAGLFGRSNSLISPTVEIESVPTSIGVGRPTSMYFPDVAVNPDTELFSSVIDSVDVEKELSSPTPELQKLNVKAIQTFYKTYTYFTTIFVDGETTITSRTEVYTNYITPSAALIQPTSVQSKSFFTKSPSLEFYDQLEAPQSHVTHVLQNTDEYVPLRSLTFKSTPRNTYSSTISRNNFKQNSDITTLLSSSQIEDDEENKIFRSSTPKLDKAYLYSTLTSRSHYKNTDEAIPSKSYFPPTAEHLKSESADNSFLKEFNVEMMSTDVTSSSSGGEATPKLEKNEKADILEDQISSESNTEEIQPSATLALVTSYTTFTYFTTLYKTNASSDVISRLETITNVVTETITPRQTLLPSDVQYQAFPLTEFTTFTYWTTLYRGGSSTITSREETVTNIIPATEIYPQVINISPLQITPTPTVVESVQSSTLAPLLLQTFTIGDNDEENVPKSTSVEVTVDPTTEYTTFTYFTTSYIGDSTVVNSRFETVTNVVNNTVTISDVQSARAVGTIAPSNQLIVDGVDKTKSTGTIQASSLYPTGLLSTIMASEVNNGTTTLFSTDVFGTYIDGKYAKVLESSTMVIKPTPVPSPVQSSNTLPTGVVSLNEGRIVDADGISTTYFTTKAIGTYIADLYAQVVETTSSVQIDPEKTATASASETQSSPFKTGLVRLIEGSVVQDGITTFYESKVVGTVIDGRYAQIIESTSSFKVDASPTSSIGVKEILPTSSLSSDQSISPTALTTAPSPVVIESSIGDTTAKKEDKEEENDDEDDDESENEDDDNQSNSGKGRVKSRLTFSTRKKTFTPVIRPFIGISRNRPTFNPRKPISPATSATTITRTTLTPTITASPAAKTDRTGGSSRGRFSNNRRQSLTHTAVNEIQPTPSSSRRFSRTRASSSSGTYSTSGSPGRGRSSTSGRIHATSSYGPSGSSRRGGNYRTSSRPGGSSIYPGSSSNRIRIRPTASIGRGQSTPTAQHTTPSNADIVGPEENDLTTLMTEETGLFTDEEDTPTQSISTTTESFRRSTNPLLRFRRPPGLRVSQSASTSRPSTTPATKKNSQTRKPNNNRVGTTSTTPKSRSENSISNRYKALSTNRQRTSNSLFPPRSLFKRPGQEDDAEGKKNEEEDELDENEEEQNENEEGGEEDEFEDNDYEGSERAEEKTVANRRSGTAYNTVQIRPFARRTRVKRQTEYGTRNSQGSSRSYTSRFRRPSSKVTPQAQDRIDSIEETITEAPKIRASSAGRFTPKARSQSSEQVQSTQQKIRPTPSTTYTGRSQFTLREKDTTASTRANFKRPSTTTASRRRPSNSRPETTTVAQRPKAPRLRTQQHTDATTYSRSNGRRYNTNTNTNRGRSSSRTRFRDSNDFDTYTYSQSSFDGTITVTHRVPTEVTIPIVNGKITEYKNVITASPSTEVLGPHQYTVTTGKNGNTLFQLTSEVTGTLPNGITEVTQFLLRNTPTTSIVFTPTVIRGRKTSFSHVIPSTVYEVEQVVSTVQPQISPNAPLANILLSQLLLGNINLQPNINPLLAINNSPSASPTTEFKTRTTTYVTTVTKGTSTIIPLTFRGKEILTTIVDSSLEVITATEFLTDTIVVTPTATNNQLNSLLLPALLQAQLLGNQQTQQPNVNSLFGNTQQGVSTDQQKLLVDDFFVDDESRKLLSQRQRIKSEDIDRPARDSEKDILDDDFFQSAEEDEDVSIRIKPSRKKLVSKNNDANKRLPDPPPIIAAETSIVTLYVSGRRPGEFSTVLSTVTLGEDSTIRKREAEFIVPEMVKVRPSKVPDLGSSFPQDDFIDNYLMPALNEISVESSEIETQSLESIVGDVSLYVSNVQSVTDTGKFQPSQTEKESFRSKTKNSVSLNPNKSNTTGHFLLKGPAESAPLKRKVYSVIEGGEEDKLNEGCKVADYKSLLSLCQKETMSLARKIRDISGQSEDIDNIPRNPAHRRRVRVRVPVRRNKSDASQENREIFSLSEAQMNERIPVMEFNTNDKKSSVDFGSRKAAAFRDKNADQETQQTSSEHHRKRIVIARKKRPVDSMTIESSEETLLNNNSESTERNGISEHPELTTKKEESDNKKESDYVTSDEAELNKSSSKSSKRKRILLTRKRPVSSVAPTTSESHSRRRIVITKRRPAQTYNAEDFKTSVLAIPESMSTLYSYKYTVMDDADINNGNIKMTRVSQLFMSGEISSDDKSVTVAIAPSSTKASYNTKYYDNKNEEDDFTSLNTKERNVPIESSFTSVYRSEEQKIQSSNINSEDDKTTVVPEIVDTQFTEIPEIVTLPVDQFYGVSKDSALDNIDELTDQEKEKGHKNVAEPSPETLPITTESEDNVPVTTPEDTEASEGPKFIRPTRFSITRKPERTRPSFAGQRRRTSSTTSSIQPTTSSSYKPSYRTRKPSLSTSSSSKSFSRHTKHHRYSSPHEKIVTSSETSVHKSKFTPSSSFKEDFSSSELISPSSELMSVQSTETVTETPTLLTELVTSTRLRTFTFIVTRVAGDEIEVTSTTEVKPHVTTLTVTRPLSISAELNTESKIDGSEGRALNLMNANEARYNLATKVMSNGVEVIVAQDKTTRPGEPEVLRILSSSLTRPITLAPSTLSDHMLLLLPSDSQSSSLNTDIFATKTYLTTYTYLTTFFQDGTTSVSSNEKIITNVVTEERSKTIFVTPTPTLTISDSSHLATGVFHTTYTYLNTLLDGDVPLVVTSTHTVKNTITAPENYLLQLQPSESVAQNTNTYLSTIAFTKTLTDGLDTKVVSTKDVLTQVVITNSALQIPEVSSPNAELYQTRPLQGYFTDVVKTYFVTYTYYNTLLDGDSTVVQSDVATSSDIVTEKVFVGPKRTTSHDNINQLSDTAVEVTPTQMALSSEKPIQLFATKTYLTTFTYFTTLLQDIGNDKTSTTVQSETRVVSNVVTEAVPINLLSSDYISSLRLSLDANSTNSFVTLATLPGGHEVTITAVQGDNTSIKPTSTFEIPATASDIEIIPSLSSSMDEQISSNNDIISGSTIIFFDETDQIDSNTKPTPALSVIQSTGIFSSSSSPEIIADSTENPVVSETYADPAPFPSGIITSILTSATVTSNGATLKPGDEVIMMTQSNGNVTMIPVSDPTNKKPNGGLLGGPGGSEIEVSDLLSLGSLGINSLNALGPVINAMAGLINGNLHPSAKRRNDTFPNEFFSTTHTRPTHEDDRQHPVYIPEKHAIRNPIYIPVGGIAADINDKNDDIATAESHRFEGHVNINQDKRGSIKWVNPDSDYVDTRQRHRTSDVIHGRVPMESSILSDGIPISPGEVITTNSDIIIGKHAAVGPRPPKLSDTVDSVPIGMKPPPPPFQPIKNNHYTIAHPKPSLDNEALGLHTYENIHHPPPPMPIPEGDHLIPSNHKGHISVLDHNTESSNTFHHVNKFNNEIIHGNHIQANHIIPAPVNIPVIDRSTGQSLLVNIQPSQVANVIIPNPSANIFGFNHGLSNNGYHDNSPIPLPENSPGFIGIDNHNQQDILNVPHNDYSRIHTHPSPDMKYNQHSNDIKVDIVSGQGINIDVVPGQNMNVEIVPEHLLQQNSFVKIQNSHMSPNGIVLDAPLQNRPQKNEIHSHRKQPPHGASSVVRLPSGFSLHNQKIPEGFITHHVQKFPHHHPINVPNGHKNPPPPFDYMVPPPPPQYHQNTKKPIPIPINENRLQIPVQIPENLLPHDTGIFDKGENGDHIETEEGEVLQESVKRPLRPGQLPTEQQTTTETSIVPPTGVYIKSPPLSAEELLEDKEILFTDKPPISNFINKPHSHNSAANLHHKPSQSHTSAEIYHSNKPLVNFDDKPPIDTYNPPMKPQVHYSGSADFNDQIAHRPSFAERPSNYHLDKRPISSKFDPASEEYDESLSSEEKDHVSTTTGRPEIFEYDLQVQGSSPRPFTAVPTSQTHGANVITHKPILHLNKLPGEEIVMGLKPPPLPQKQPIHTTNIGQKPVGTSSNINQPAVTNLHPQRPSQSSVSVNENKRPVTSAPTLNRNKISSTTPPYEFETPTPPPIKDILVAESTGKPLWIKPALHEIPSPTNISRPQEQKPTRKPPEYEKPTRPTIQQQKPSKQPVQQQKPTRQPIQEQKPTRQPVLEQKPTRPTISEPKPSRHPDQQNNPTKQTVSQQTFGLRPAEEEKPDRPVQPTRQSVLQGKPNRWPAPQENPTIPPLQQEKPNRPEILQEKPIRLTVPKEKPNRQPELPDASVRPPIQQNKPNRAPIQYQSINRQPIQQESLLPQEKPIKQSNENFIETKKPSVSEYNENFSRPVISPTSWIPTENGKPLPDKPLLVSSNIQITSSQKPISVSTVGANPTNTYPIQSPKPVKPSSPITMDNLKTVISKPIYKDSVSSSIFIKPTSVKESSHHKTSTRYNTPNVIVGSETIYPEFTNLPTPTAEVSSRRKEPTRVASPFVTSTSKTIFGQPFTKSVTNVVPSNLLVPSVTQKPPYEHKVPDRNIVTKNEDDEDNKSDLGVASSNNKGIVFGNVDYSPAVTTKPPTRYVTHTETQTVTTTETTVISSIGHLPSTKTVVLTRTQTSTRVETVTQIHTLVKPTSITATVTTTVSATISQYSPNYSTIRPVPSLQNNKDEIKTVENIVTTRKTITPTQTVDKFKVNTKSTTVHETDNDTFFVIVNDQKPGTVHITNPHDDTDNSLDTSKKDSERINQGVFLGGVLVAPPPSQETSNGYGSPVKPFATACDPECSPSRNELCQRVQGEMKCVCRPGFARIFSDRPCKPTYTYSLRLPLISHGREELRYDNSLVDSSSPQYHQVSESTREALDRMVMQSDLRDIYHGVAIDSFQPSMKENGIMVSFYVQLSDNTEEGRLKDVFKKSLRTSNYSLGGTNMFADKDLLQYIEAEDFDECQNSKFHDCSENARCFNLRGTYTCSCKEGYTDLSENAAFPGRLCSAELIGCDKCHYHGTCYPRGDDQVVCECFQWYAGDHCQINLKVLLIALVTIGALLLALLLVCIILTCFKRSRKNVAQVTRPNAPRFLQYRRTTPRTQTLDKRAMIQDSSSEGSVENAPVAYMTPTPQVGSPVQQEHNQINPSGSICQDIANSPTEITTTVVIEEVPPAEQDMIQISSPDSVFKDSIDDSTDVTSDDASQPTNFSSKLKKQPGIKKVTTVGSDSETLKSVGYTDQRDRSLTVMIPRAKYRPVPPLSPILTMSTFGAPEKRAIAQEQKLLCYLENNGKQEKGGKSNGHHKKHSAPMIQKPSAESSPPRKASPPRKQSPGVSGALVSAGFEVSATVGGRKEPEGTSADVHVNTLASGGSHFTTTRTDNSTTTAGNQQTDSKQVSSNVDIDLTVSEARSCDETTIHPPTKSLHSNYKNKGGSDTLHHEEGHTMAERDVGSTLLMPHQTHLYNADRSSDISNFDSL